MTTKGIYIYGIVPNFYGADMFRSLESSGAYVISFQNISAIVSDRETADIDFSDRELLAHLLVNHQKTIEEIMAIGFNMILPIKFGTVVRTKTEAINILSKGYDLIITTLKTVEHLTEIDLAVTWADFAGTLKDIANHPDVIEMKDNIMKNMEDLSQVNQMKVGMLVKEKLDIKNKQVELEILDSLSPFGVDIKMHEVMDDQMIINSAFLINRNNKEKFEQVIDWLDEEFKGALNFKLVGPLPCYSFYTIEIKELNPEHLEQAKKELGVREETSESEIKNTYLEKTKLFHPDVQLDNGNEENFIRINKAYHTLLNYSMAAKQTMKNDHFSLSKEKVAENLILVTIKG